MYKRVKERFQNLYNLIKNFLNYLKNMSKCVIINLGFVALGNYLRKGDDSMYDVLDVCRYVINYSNDKEYGVSNLKLQKLLYFIQAYFLISKPNSKCFGEKIEAWDFGPVIPCAYHEYKQYGSRNIPYISTYYKFDKTNIWNTERVLFDSSIIAQKDKELINEVVDTFSSYSATDLITLTHNQSPWIDAYEPGMNNEITTDAIKEYFLNE